MKRYGLIGRTLAHSFSARYFTEKFRREGLDKEYSYELFELPEIGCVEELINDTPDLAGFNVTIPYKQQIIPHLDALDAEAQAIGAVNCVKIADGRRTGYNTDIAGIRVSLDELLGAQRDIPFAIVSRDAAKGNYTYDDLDSEAISTHHLVINTTPVGMYPKVDQAPEIPYELLTPSHRLFDLIYNPEQTLFARRGAERGARTMTGLRMLYAQAEAAWKIWNE